MRKLILSILFFAPLFLLGQGKKGVGVSSHFYYGNIIRHRTILAYEQPKQVYGFSFCISQRTLGVKQWQYFHRYPEVGVGVAYFNLGNKNVLGEALGVLAQISYNIMETPRLAVNGEIALGVGYISRHYDVVHNPTNNAIGSSVNNMTIVNLNTSYHLNHKFTISGAIALTHLSNGALKLPNLGINILEGSFGVKYHLNPVITKDEFIKYDKLENQSDHKFGLQLQYNLGAKASVFNGFLYRIPSINLKGVYFYNKILKWQLGFGFEQRRDLRQQLIENHIINSEKSTSGSGRLMLMLAQELVFDKLGLFGEVGVYLSKQSVELEKPFYFKVGARYYVPIYPCLYFESYIKTHLFTGDHFALGVGIEL